MKRFVVIRNEKISSHCSSFGWKTNLFTYCSWEYLSLDKLWRRRRRRSSLNVKRGRKEDLNYSALCSWENDEHKANSYYHLPQGEFMFISWNLFTMLGVDNRFCCCCHLSTFDFMRRLSLKMAKCPIAEDKTWQHSTLLPSCYWMVLDKYNLCHSNGPVVLTANET